MKKLLLAMSLLLLSMPIFADGSDTVFFRSIDKFFITDDLGEAITHPGLSEELEELDRPTLVIKVGWYNYINVLVYTINGYNVQITFGDNPPLVFTWNDTLDAVTADGNDGIVLYLLSP